MRYETPEAKQLPKEELDRRICQFETICRTYSIQKKKIRKFEDTVPWALDPNIDTSTFSEKEIRMLRRYRIMKEETAFVERVFNGIGNHWGKGVCSLLRDRLIYGMAAEEVAEIYGYTKKQIYSRRRSWLTSVLSEDPYFDAELDDEPFELDAPVSASKPKKKSVRRKNGQKKK